MSKYVLECRNLSKMYDEGTSHVEVFSNVNLQVAPSEMVAIVGISGSGKSTLLHLLGGLDKPTQGQVIVADQDITRLSENEKSRLRNHHLGFIYQFHHLLPEFTALENVCMPLLVRNTPPDIAMEKAKQLLGAVQLKHRLSHKTGQLSGGERQRVAIARALVTDPLCVLADEPTGNLDPRNAERVLQLFIELQQTFKMSVVMVTHDRQIAQRAQRVLTIEDGRLV